MEWSGRARRAGDWIWLLGWCAVSSVWCVTAGGELSATWDEPIYLDCGLERWRTGSHQGLIERGVMPLPVELITLPLYLWERVQGVQFDVTSDLERLLPWARAGTLAFWWLLLIYAWRAGRCLAGPWGGRFAVSFLSCEPSLLAHASLATTDISISACLLALVYSFHKGREGGWLRRVGLPAFWFGASLLAKASALVFAPICLVVVALVRLRRGHGWFEWFRIVMTLKEQSWRDLGEVIVCGLILALLYCFTAAEGLIRQIQQNLNGHAAGAYLMGETRPGGFWYYFPVALTIKLTLPLLALPLLLAVVRPRVLANWAFLAAAALLAFSPMFRVQTGVRFVLPLVVLAEVGLAAGVVLAWRECASRWRRCLLAAGSGTGLIWAGWTAVSVWPHGLCYTNELWGGTEQGYRYLSDSNYDWGQGLKELARWQQEHGIATLDVWYFGTDLPLKSLPMRQVNLEDLSGPDDVLAQAAGQYLAASTTLLYGSHTQAGAFLRAKQSVARTTTFFIYDFTQGTENDQKCKTQPDQ